MEKKIKCLYVYMNIYRVFYYAENIISRFYAGEPTFGVRYVNCCTDDQMPSLDFVCIVFCEY